MSAHRRAQPGAKPPKRKGTARDLLERYAPHLLPENRGNPPPVTE